MRLTTRIARLMNQLHFAVRVGLYLAMHSELIASDAESSSRRSGHTLTKKKKEQESKPCEESLDASGASSGSTDGQSPLDLFSAIGSEQNTSPDSSKESASTAKSTDSSKLATNPSDLSKLNLKQRVVLLRYKDSGTAAVWTEGGEDKSPVIAIDLHTVIDITGIASEVASKKAKDNERKKKYLIKTLTTQALAEYAFIVWHGEEGCQLDKKMLKQRLENMRYNPYPMETKNGWTVTVVSTSDYHGELIVPAAALYNPKYLFVHAVRFGTNEKIILRGWTSAKYVKLVGRPFSKHYQGRGGKPFVTEKYRFEPKELFPMSLLGRQLEKKAALSIEPKQTRMGGDDFGF